MEHRDMPDWSLAMVDPGTGYCLAMGFKVDRGYAHANRWNERTLADGYRLSAYCDDDGIAEYGRGDHQSIPVVPRPEV